jgi:hypothetical protein
VPANVGVRHAIASGQSIEHLDGYLEASEGEPARMDELARLTAEAGVWNAPTLDVWKTLIGLRAPAELDGRPELAYMPRERVDDWRRRTAALSRGSFLRSALVSLGLRRSPAEVAALRDRMLAALHRAGARLLLGSDSPQLYSVPGFSLVHELRAMVAAGVPVYDVLQAGTRGPAEYFGQPEVFGRVAVGLRADLLLLEANPLEDVGHVQRQAGVALRGCWLPRAEVERRLGEIAGRARRGGPVNGAAAGLQAASPPDGSRGVFAATRAHERPLSLRSVVGRRGS